MIEIPNQLKSILSLISNGMIWVYILLFFVLSYLLVSLLTWSFKKPLKYLGIPTIIVGALFIIIRFISPLLLDFIGDMDELNIIKILLPNILEPVLIYGIGCLLIGILMVVIGKIIDKKNNLFK